MECISWASCGGGGATIQGDAFIIISSWGVLGPQSHTMGFHRHFDEHTLLLSKFCCSLLWSFGEWMCINSFIDTLSIVCATRNSLANLLIMISISIVSFSVGRTTPSHRLLRLLFITCLPLSLVSLRDRTNRPSSVLYQLQYHYCRGTILLHGVR